MSFGANPRLFYQFYPSWPSTSEIGINESMAKSPKSFKVCLEPPILDFEKLLTMAL
jgi:hypothetical protein